MKGLLEKAVSKCDLISHSQIAYAILLPIDRANIAFVSNIEKFYACLEQVNTSFLLEVFKEDFRSMLSQLKHDYELYQRNIPGYELNNSWEGYTKNYFLATLDSPLAEGTEEYDDLEGYWDDWWGEGRIFSYLDAIVYYLSGSQSYPSVYILKDADSNDDVKFVQSVYEKYETWIHQFVREHSEEIYEYCKDLIYVGGNDVE